MSSKSKEADGITAVPDPPAPEEVEEPAAAEADAEAEEGDEPKPDPAAEQKLPAAAKNPDEFPQKDGIIIELSAVPLVSSHGTFCALLTAGRSLDYLMQQVHLCRSSSIVCSLATVVGLCSVSLCYNACSMPAGLQNK